LKETSGQVRSIRKLLKNREVTGGHARLIGTIVQTKRGGRKHAGNRGRKGVGSACDRRGGEESHVCVRRSEGVKRDTPEQKETRGCALNRQVRSEKEMMGQEKSTG